jgi:rare lipoprotein A (peptidoglycan hydrolase)
MRWNIGPWELDRFLRTLDRLAMLEIELKDETDPLLDARARVKGMRAMRACKPLVKKQVACPSDRTKGGARQKYVQGGEGMGRAQRLALLSAVLAFSGCTMIGYPRLENPLPPSENVVDGVRTAESPSRGGNPTEYEQSGGTYRVLDSSFGYDERGVASWYGEQFQGRRTSSGERFDMYALSAAHRTLPLPAWVRVTNLDNGLSLLLRLNDRGPFADTGHRIIDVSYAAAIQLGMVESGTVPVRVQAVEPWQYRVPGSL